MYHRFKTTGSSTITAANVTVGTRRFTTLLPHSRLNLWFVDQTAPHLEQLVKKDACHEDLNNKSLERTEMKYLGSLLTRLQLDALLRALTLCRAVKSRSLQLACSVGWFTRQGQLVALRLYDHWRLPRCCSVAFCRLRRRSAAVTSCRSPEIAGFLNLRASCTC